MDELNLVKIADAEVRRDIAYWEEKANGYVEEIFDNDIERVYGTQFSDNLAIIADLAENATAAPKTFRGIRDQVGRLQAAAIVRQVSNYLEVDFMATAPWNILQNQPESVKGAGTTLMEELVKESFSLGFGGRLKLYSIPRAKQFYEKIGLEATSEGDWELTPRAAEKFLLRRERSRRE